MGKIAYCDEQTCQDAKESSNPDADSQSRNRVFQDALHDPRRSSRNRSEAFDTPSPLRCFLGLVPACSSAAATVAIYYLHRLQVKFILFMLIPMSNVCPGQCTMSQICMPTGKQGVNASGVSKAGNKSVNTRLMKWFYLIAMDIVPMSRSLTGSVTKKGQYQTEKI